MSLWGGNSNSDHMNQQQNKTSNSSSLSSDMSDGAVSDFEDSSVSSSSNEENLFNTVDQEIQFLAQKLKNTVEREQATCTTTSKKNVKLQGNPKRAKNALGYYIQHIRPQVKLEFPSQKYADITKIISTRWSSLPPEEKKPFEVLAQADHQRWEVEKKKSEKTTENMEDSIVSPKSTKNTSHKKSKKRTLPKDPTEPKKGLSSYVMFLKENRVSIKQKLLEENLNVQETEVMRQVAEAWRALTEEEKEHYKLLSKQDFERYRREKDAYDEKEKNKIKNQEEETDCGDEEEPPKKRIKKQPPSPKKTKKKTAESEKPKNRKNSKKEESEPKSGKNWKNTKKIFKVRTQGEDYFDRVVLKKFTFDKLVQKIQEKRQDYRPISLIIQLPNIRIRDNQDVADLVDNDELEVKFDHTN